MSELNQNGAVKVFFVGRNLRIGFDFSPVTGQTLGARKKTITILSALVSSSAIHLATPSTDIL